MKYSLKSLTYRDRFFIWAKIPIPKLFHFRPDHGNNDHWWFKSIHLKSVWPSDITDQALFGVKTEHPSYDVFILFLSRLEAERRYFFQIGYLGLPGRFSLLTGSWTGHKLLHFLIPIISFNFSKCNRKFQFRAIQFCTLLNSRFFNSHVTPKNFWLKSSNSS